MADPDLAPRKMEAEVLEGKNHCQSFRVHIYLGRQNVC